MISPLAHVDPSAKLGNNVTVHPFAFISKNVEIGDDCVIYPYASILNGARIGNRVKIYNGAIIAAEPQDFRWKGNPSFCYIDDDCSIREHTIINRGINPEGGTHIGQGSFVMANSHIMHDCEIEGKTVIGNGASISPGCRIESQTILSSNVVLHANSHLGKFVLVKGGCRISGNVPPYVIMAHNPVAYYGVNAFILRHCKFSEDVIDNIAKAYRHVYQCGTSTYNALMRIENDIPESSERDEIINFIRGCKLKIVAVPSHEDVDD